MCFCSLVSKIILIYHFRASHRYVAVKHKSIQNVLKALFEVCVCVCRPGFITERHVTCMNLQLYNCQGLTLSCC